MKSLRYKQRAVVLTVLYCCTAALICGEWFRSTDDESVSTRVGARSLLAIESDVKSSLPQLYHTPEVFTLNYKEMMENLRVFIYPNSQNASYEFNVTSDAVLEGAGSEVRFFNLLAKQTNVFVTKFAEEAQLFFMPVSFDALVTKLGRDSVGHHLRYYVQSLRDNFTWWDRALGSDHFYLATSGYEPFNHRNNLEFAKNAIQVACSPLPPLQFFYPHKDIVLPSYNQSDATPITPQRSHLAYIGVQSISTPSEWSTDGDFVFEASELHGAKFCVTDSMRNVVDALRAGCVPVLVSDSLLYDLPFQDIVNWHEFAVVMGAAEMKAQLKTRLSSMPAEQYERMQYLGLQASKHMEWNDPPAAYDAFHMTLFQLWMRRYSIKYARRSDS